MMMIHKKLTPLHLVLVGHAMAGFGAAFAADAPVEKVSARAVTHFDFSRAKIHPADQAAILADVGKMSDVTWQTVTATGHTDSIGRVSLNERLSERRVAAVKSYLVGKGLDPSMIRTQGKAAQAPVASNDTSAGRAQNRRTEVEFEGVRPAR